MGRKLLEYRPASWAAVLAVLVLFVGLGTWHYRDTDGQDLASSYVGSRLLLYGLPQHLFQYDPKDFAEIGEDDTWTVMANQGGFYGYLHPYVQTPLWAFALEPLAGHVRFWVFDRIFVFVTLLSFAVSIALAAWYWAPGFFNPLAVGLVVVGLCLSQPFQYAMYLNQTHMLMVFLTLLALILAERDRSIAAGFLLACAASVKITPGLLVLYWLLNRRWSAAVSTVISSGVLWALTVLAVGQGLMNVYLADLHRISQVLLVSENNQSFAAWVMARFYPADAVYDIDVLPLPTFVRLLSSGLMLLFTAWGGWLDWRRRQVLGAAAARAPLGAMVAILAATIFAPIAWTHYSIVLFLPLMLLADANRGLRRWWVWVVIAGVLLLNYRPVATDIVHGLIGDYSVVRAQFYAAVLAMAGLIAVALLEVRRRAGVGRVQPVDRVLAA